MVFRTHVWWISALPHGREKKDIMSFFLIRQLSIVLAKNLKDSRVGNLLSLGTDSCLVAGNTLLRAYFCCH